MFSIYPARTSTRNLKTRMRHSSKPGDEPYLPLVKEITDNRPTFGYRRVTAVINRTLTERGRKGQPQAGIQDHEEQSSSLQKHTGRPLRAHKGTIITLRSNMRWCSDIFEIPCGTEKVRTAFAMDCCDREIMGHIATTGGITGDMVRDLMASCIEYRFGRIDSLPHPIEWLSDNGSAYTAHETISLPGSWGSSPAQPRTTARSRTGWQNPSSKRLRGITCYA